ncbi:MAG: fumarylacetoacetate hydrolase family protein [Propionibacteriaceae bacterium]|jgi:2-keto-4-pentenoate hydratase/2-oxohepta-3-ene-1,7-dioic acid hydratase in catechol pathway|nr:fumarylacetoacetate hydrolase family protein [Propionibacteriaceae bacterium]
MRVARYAVDDTIRFGIVELAEDGGQFPDSVSDLTGDPMAGPVNLTGARHLIDDIRFLAPVIPRSKVVAFNPPGPRDDLASPASLERALLLKPNTGVIGPASPVVCPPSAGALVSRGRLAIVIGRIGKMVPPERVPEIIFGYTVADDVRASGAIGAAASFDTFTPIGPWIVTHLSLEEATTVGITTTSGEATSRGTVKESPWGIAELVSACSVIMTLLPGDLILTGPTADGPAIQPATEVTITIDEVGTLEHTVVEDDI